MVSRALRHLRSKYSDTGLAIRLASDEIEITPEMIEAGLAELWNHDITEPREDEMREAVRSVYSAMHKSRASGAE